MLGACNHCLVLGQVFERVLHQATLLHLVDRLLLLGLLGELFPEVINLSLDLHLTTLSHQNQVSIHPFHVALALELLETGVLTHVREAVHADVVLP